MSVKKIFTTLIGTIVLIVMSSVIIELFNINVTSQQVQQLTKTSADQACELFTQESYKKNSNNSGSANMTNILDTNGSVYVSGDFYGTGSSSAIYNRIYVNSGGLSSFSRLCALSLDGSPSQFTTNANVNGKTFPVTYSVSYASPTVHNKPNIYNSSRKNLVGTTFQNLNNMYHAINYASEVNYAAAYWSLYNTSQALYNKSQALKAKTMTSEMITPANIGFPFIDADVTNKIFQWNLAQLLTKGYTDSIQSDDSIAVNGEHRYIMYNGFRCYVNQAYITKLNYYIVDVVGDNSTRANQILRDYAGITNKASLNTQGGAGNENNFIVVVGVEYTMPVSYQGITPIKSIFEYVWTKEVEGYNNQNDGVADRDVDTYSYNTDNLKGNEGALSYFGELYYTLVR